MISRSPSLLLVLLVAAASCAATKWYWPSYKVETREHETVVTKVVTQIRHVKAPDGSETTDTIIVDTGREDRNRTVNTKPASKWHAQASIHTAFDGLKPEYSLGVERRILGPFFVGLQARTDGSVGLGLGMEF